MTEIFRDEAILVVDKPSGLPTQRGRDGRPGLYEQLRASEDYVGLLHRLDQPASGLVLFTLDPRANAAATTALRAHAWKRAYRAVLWGSPANTAWRRPVAGKASRSDVRVVGQRSGMAAVWVALHTGRKHQIRVQAALEGSPVVGDRRYGGEAGRAWPRLALHASRLELRHPLTAEAMCFESSLPEDLEALWRRAGGVGD